MTDGVDGQVPKQSDPQMHASSFSIEGPQVPQALVQPLMVSHASALSSPHVVWFAMELTQSPKQRKQSYSTSSLSSRHSTTSACAGEHRSITAGVGAGRVGPEVPPPDPSLGAGVARMGAWLGADCAGREDAPGGRVGPETPPPTLPIGVGVARLGARLGAMGTGREDAPGRRVGSEAPPLGVGVARFGARLGAEGAGRGDAPPHASSQPVVIIPIKHASLCLISLAQAWHPHSPPVDVAEHNTSLMSPQVNEGQLALL